MSLETILFAESTTYARVCKFAPWLAQQSEDDRNAIIRAFDNPDVTTRHIYKTLKAIGCPSAESSIRSHRVGECQHCERTNYGVNV